MVAPSKPARAVGIQKARSSAPSRRTRNSSSSAVAAADRGGEDETHELGRTRSRAVVDGATAEERVGLDEAAGRGADMLGARHAAKEQALAAKEAALAAKLKELAATFILTARHLEGGVRMCVWVCVAGHAHPPQPLTSSPANPCD